jgi:hypothetical protein
MSTRSRRRYTKALITSGERWPELPDVPTFRQSGVEGEAISGSLLSRCQERGRSAATMRPGTASCEAALFVRARTVLTSPMSRPSRHQCLGRAGSRPRPFLRAQPRRGAWVRPSIGACNAWSIMRSLPKLRPEISSLRQPWIVQPIPGCRVAWRRSPLQGALPALLGHAHSGCHRGGAWCARACNRAEH